MKNPKTEIRNSKQARISKFKLFKHFNFKFVSNFDIRVSKFNKRGLTLIEVIITAAILSLIAALAASSLSNFKKDKALDADTRAVVSLVDEARSATLAARDDAAWGVHFQTDKAVMYKTTYSAGASTNIEYVLSKSIYFSAITLTGGGSDLLFTRLTGATSNYGTTTLSERTGSTTRSIIISPAGVVR